MSQTTKIEFVALIKDKRRILIAQRNNITKEMDHFARNEGQPWSANRAITENQFNCCKKYIVK